MGAPFNLCTVFVNVSPVPECKRMQMPELVRYEIMSDAGNADAGGFILDADDQLVVL
jgi:hypothetical protein